MLLSLCLAHPLPRAPPGTRWPQSCSCCCSPSHHLLRSHCPSLGGSTNSGVLVYFTWLPLPLSKLTSLGDSTGGGQNLSGLLWLRPQITLQEPPCSLSPTQNSHCQALLELARQEQGRGGAVALGLCRQARAPDRVIQGTGTQEGGL